MPHHRYTAIKNQGSYLSMPVRANGATNGATPTPHKIRLPRKTYPSPLEGLSKALVAIEWGSDRQGHNWRIKYETFAKLAAGPEEGGKMVHSLRSMGSAALNFCAVAAGNIDLYWVSFFFVPTFRDEHLRCLLFSLANMKQEGGCWAWDVAAGWLILTEAGGLVVDTNPGGWTPAVDGRRYMAVRGAPSGQKEIIEEFWNIVPNGGYDYSV